MPTHRRDDPEGTFRFQSGKPRENREAVDRLIDKLQSTFIGRVFSISADVQHGQARLSVSLAPMDHRQPNYGIGVIIIAADEAVPQEQIITPVRRAIDQLMDRER